MIEVIKDMLGVEILHGDILFIITGKCASCKLFQVKSLMELQYSHSYYDIELRQSGQGERRASNVINLGSYINDGYIESLKPFTGRLMKYIRERKGSVGINSYFARDGELVYGEYGLFIHRVNGNLIYHLGIVTGDSCVYTGLGNKRKGLFLSIRDDRILGEQKHRGIYVGLLEELRGKW